LLPILLTLPLLACQPLFPWSAGERARIGFLPVQAANKVLLFDLTNLREVGALALPDLPGGVGSTVSAKLLVIAQPAAKRLRAYVRRGNTTFDPLGDVPVDGTPEQVVVNQLGHEVLVTMPKENRVALLRYSGYQGPPQVVDTVTLPEPPVAVSTSNGESSVITRKRLYTLKLVDGRLQAEWYWDSPTDNGSQDYQDLGKFADWHLVTDAGQDALLIYRGGTMPRVIPLSPGGRAAKPGRVVSRGPVAYVACTGTNTIAVVDLEAGEVLGHVDLGVTPSGLAWEDLESRLYVTSASSSTLTVIKRDDRVLLSGRPTFTETVERSVPLSSPVGATIQSTSNPFSAYEGSDPPDDPAWR
jgi:DNA-binding beta-propeller fold protein YncE